MILPVPQFTLPSYGDRTLNEVQMCANFYPEKTPGGAVLVSYPGYSTLGAVPNNSACRWGYTASNGTRYSVNGNTLYLLSSTTGAVSLTIGTMSLSSGHLYFADNGSQLLVVQEGTNGYIYDFSPGGGGAFALISDVNFPTNPYGAVFIDGYFIVTDGTTGKFYLSQLLDGLDWTPTQFATAEYSGDLSANVARIGGHLYIFGGQTIELWANTGNSDFPFERITGGTVSVGIGSARSTAVLNDVAYFVGSPSPGQRPVYALSPGGIKKISTPYIESLIWNQSSLNWYGYAYSLDGHDFYVIKNTTSGGVYGYDITSDAWFEICPVGGSYPVQIVLSGSHTETTGALALSTSTSFPINRMSQATNSNTGSRIRIFGPIESDTKKVFHAQIRIELEMKFDATGATTISPTLDWTDDGGLSYSTAITMTKTVTNTTTGQRVVLTANRLGSSAARYYRLTLPGAARFVLKKCELDLKQGRF